jgi:predicted nucleotidyltransferase
MRDLIINKLSELEEDKGIRILYACESGSRAWGFHSPDSDYDVRFIYAHEKDWYLGIEDRKDFIELPINDDLDIVGYDLRKMLKLFRASNAKIYEWLQSPVVYKKDHTFHDDIRALMPDYYSLRSGVHHYIGLTRNTFEQDLQTEQVKLKKYFYALRPVLAAAWIVEKKVYPPMEFGQLRAMVKDDNINNQIEDLLQRKIKAGEKHFISREPSLNEFIATRMEHCMQAAAAFKSPYNDVTPLNKLFQKTIGL